MSLRDLYPGPGGSIEWTDRPPKRIAHPPEMPMRGGKGTAVYLAHSYPTKVPPEAIEPLLRHFTRPGDIVCDPFAGSGMTGVAAMRLGRHAYLNDLSPLATHLSRNVTTPCDDEELAKAADEILRVARQDFASWYGARCTSCGGDAILEWLLWGDTVQCPACSAPVRLWDAGFDRFLGRMPRNVKCPSCRTSFPKTGVKLLESAPVWASISCPAGCARSQRPALHSDAVAAAQHDLTSIHDWFPRVALGSDREMYIRSALHLRGIREVADFYTIRNLRALARLWKLIRSWPDLRVRQALAFAFTNTAWHGTRMRRFNARGGQRPLTGTLYIPQMSVEVNVASVFSHKIDQLRRFYSTEKFGGSVIHTYTGSATYLREIPDASVDYVFTDPPFGSNIFYADCNSIAEAWLDELTPTAAEAVVNRSLGYAAGGKRIDQYGEIMAQAFVEVARILKPSAWATVVFQNTDPTIWKALRDATDAAGLAFERATTLDKTQHSHKGYKGRSGVEDVAAFDIVLSLRRRPAVRHAHRHPVKKRRVADAVALLREHLGGLPPIASSPEADRKRTLPYMYSLLLEAHFNGDIGLEADGFAGLRRLCLANFRADDEGRWLVSGQPTVTPQQGTVRNDRGGLRVRRR
jgi:DNA methylase